MSSNIQVLGVKEYKYIKSSVLFSTLINFNTLYYNFSSGLQSYYLQLKNQYTK